MSRYFDRASVELIYVESAVADVPCTFACWFNVTDITNAHGLISISQYSAVGGGDFMRLVARGNVAGDPLSAHSFDGSDSKLADSSSGYSADVWNHGCAIFAADNDRRVYLNGGLKGTNADSQSVDNIDRTAIGGQRRDDTPTDGTDGSIAEAAIWNVALSDEEVAVLATGIRPILVRPQSLVMYVPLIRDNDEDLIEGLSFSEQNTPTISTHAPVIYGGL
jgi:hypothetical protein